jgi:3-deoxy-D-manno-octulosonic acid kinase
VILPAGYDEFVFPARGARVVALAAVAGAVREAMSTATLYEWAARSPGARELSGRGAAWAATLPNGTDVVVRHSRHGGVLAPVTSDLFLAPTRAPNELRAAVRLAQAGVPTSEVLAFAVYPAVGPFARADVATRRLLGADFPDAWRGARTETEREAIMTATATLLGRMRDAGALHPDLNLKNVFIGGSGADKTAFILDVDRVEFGEGNSREIGARNLSRFLRSARKWNAEQQLGIGWETHLAALVGLSREQGA